MRFRSVDGQWTVEVIRLTLTGSNRDGECFRVSHYGSFVAEARTIDELREHVDLAELEEALAITRLRQCRVRFLRPRQPASRPGEHHHPGHGLDHGSLPAGEAGVSSAIIDTTREVGGALGIAVPGSLTNADYQASTGTSPFVMPTTAWPRGPLLGTIEQRDSSSRRKA
ncbi:MAG: hypothetical protein ACLP52_13630 [Streptosporangiaceae bacterium]